MSGTTEGGRKASITNRKKYGKDFYAKIGSIGGKLGHTGGFYANRELARVAGAKGGRKSRRGKAQKVKGLEDYEMKYIPHTAPSQVTKSNDGGMWDRIKEKLHV